MRCVASANVKMHAEIYFAEPQLRLSHRYGALDSADAAFQSARTRALRAAVSRKRPASASFARTLRTISPKLRERYVVWGIQNV